MEWLNIRASLDNLHILSNRPQKFISIILLETLYEKEIPFSHCWDSVLSIFNILVQMKKWKY